MVGSGELKNMIGNNSNGSGCKGRTESQQNIVNRYLYIITFISHVNNFYIQKQLYLDKGIRRFGVEKLKGHK